MVTATLSFIKIPPVSSGLTRAWMPRTLHIAGLQPRRLGAVYPGGLGFLGFGFLDLNRVALYAVIKNRCDDIIVLDVRSLVYG